MQKEQNKLLNAKLKAYKQIEEMFKGPDFDSNRSDVIIRESIMKCQSGVDGATTKWGKMFWNARKRCVVVI